MPDNSQMNWRRGTTGSGDIRKNLAKLIKEVPKEVARATAAEWQINKRESMARTPWLTRELQKSHRVIKPEIERGRIYSGLSVGNELTESYAIPVHEDLEMFHPRGGQAKFLESVVLETAPYMASRIAHRVDLSRALHDTPDVEDPE